MAKQPGGISGTLTLETDAMVPDGDLARLLLSFITTSSESILITDADLDSETGPRIQFANHSAQDYTGYLESDLIGQPLSILYPPEIMPQIITDMRESIRTGRAMRCERQVRAASGQIFWVEIEAVPVADDQGRIVRFIRSGRNITHRKHAEMLRASSERLLASVLGVTREAMVVIAGTGHIALANAAFTKRFGWTAAELDSTLWQDHLAGHNAERVMSEITKPAEGIREVAATIRHQDGGTLPCMLLVSTVHEPGSMLYYVLTVAPEQMPHSPLAFMDERKPLIHRAPGDPSQDPVLETVYRRNGMPSHFHLIHPPAALRAKMAAARGMILGEDGRPFDVDLMWLHWAADEAARDHAAAGNRYFGIPLDYALFDTHERAEAYLALCRKLAPAQRSRIVPILHHVPPLTNRERVGAVAQLLKPYSRYVGFDYVELGGSLVGARHQATLVTLTPNRLARDPHIAGRLDKIVSQLHMDGARVLAMHLVNAEDVNTFLTAGADLVAGDGVRAPDSPISS